MSASVCEEALCSLPFTPPHSVGFTASQTPVGVPAVSPSSANKAIRGFMGILWLVVRPSSRGCGDSCLGPGMSAAHPPAPREGPGRAPPLSHVLSSLILGHWLIFTFWHSFQAILEISPKKMIMVMIA